MSQCRFNKLLCNRTLELNIYHLCLAAPIDSRVVYLTTGDSVSAEFTFLVQFLINKVLNADVHEGDHR